MSYQDPYSSHRAAGSSSRYQNAYPRQDYVGQGPDYSNSYPPNQPYDNNGSNETYNPYAANNTQPYMNDEPDYSYGQNQRADYNDYPPPQRSATQNSTKSRTKKPTVSLTAAQKEASGFDQGEFTPKIPVVPKSRTARALREYRYDHQGNLWTKGGRGRCAGRVCCCTLMTAVFLIVSVVLALALWVRPPSISIGSVQTMGNPIQDTTNGLQVNLGVNISVSNPNYFSVDFKRIQADITYPPNNFPIGDGSASNILFNSRTQTNFTFPFALKYNNTADTGNVVLLDIANKCGIPNGTKQDITVNYKITLGIRILLITISPVISNSFNFPCPLSQSDIQKFLGSNI